MDIEEKLDHLYNMVVDDGIDLNDEEYNDSAEELILELMDDFERRKNIEDILEDMVDSKIDDTPDKFTFGEKSERVSIRGDLSDVESMKRKIENAIALISYSSLLAELEDEVDSKKRAELVRDFLDEYDFREGLYSLLDE